MDREWGVLPSAQRKGGDAPRILGTLDLEVPVALLAAHADVALGRVGAPQWDDGRHAVWVACALFVVGDREARAGVVFALRLATVQ